MKAWWIGGALALVTAWSANAQTDSYYLVQTGKAAFVAVNIGTITGSGPDTTATTLTILPEDQRLSVGLTAYMITRMAFDCDGRRLQTLHIDSYSRDGALLPGKPVPSNWKPVTTDSVGELLWNAVCTTASRKPELLASETIPRFLETYREYAAGLK